MKRIILLPILLVAAASPLFASQTTPTSTSRLSSESLSRFGKSAREAYRGARDEYRNIKGQEVKPETETTREALLRRGERFVRAGAAGARSGLTKYDAMRLKATTRPQASTATEATETAATAA